MVEFELVSKEMYINEGVEMVTGCSSRESVGNGMRVKVAREQSSERRH